MAKVLYIIAQHGFQDHEFAGSKAELEKAGHKVVVASFVKGPANGAFGMTAAVDIAFDDVNTDDYDMVTVIGGGGMAEIADDNIKSAPIVKIIKEMKAKGKLISAICIAPVMLAKAGVLKGKRATVYETPGTVMGLEKAGAAYTGENVTVDGDTITANGPPAAESFGKKLAEALR